MKPKFTIQHMLWATLAFGFAALAMSAAYRGSMIASGIVFAPLVMFVAFAVLAAIYWPCYLVSRLLYPPIHTPTPVDFSKSPSSYENSSADSPNAVATPPVDDDAPTGASE